VNPILIVGPLEAIELGRRGSYEPVHDGELAAAETTDLLECFLHNIDRTGERALNCRTAVGLRPSLTDQ
jgi:hypothetical protein